MFGNVCYVYWNVVRHLFQREGITVGMSGIGIRMQGLGTDVSMRAYFHPYCQDFIQIFPHGMADFETVFTVLRKSDSLLV